MGLNLHFKAIATVKNIAPGKVDLALSLVGYDEDVSKAMEYVFGLTLICQGLFVFIVFFFNF